MMKIRARFPLPRRTAGLPGAERNFKVIRESILLDSIDNGFERKLVSIADVSRGKDHEVFVSRTYGPAGRFSVWIVDRDMKGKRLERRKALKAALGRAKGASS